MMRTVDFVCGAFLLAISPMPSEPANAGPGIHAVTRTATMEAIDKANRTVTLKGSAGDGQIKAPEQMEGFNNLRVGDQVTGNLFRRYRRQPAQARRPRAP